MSTYVTCIYKYFIKQEFALETEGNLEAASVFFVHLKKKNPKKKLKHIKEVFG